MCECMVPDVPEIDQDKMVTDELSEILKSKELVAQAVNLYKSILSEKRLLVQRKGICQPCTSMGPK